MIRRWLPFAAGAGIVIWVTALVMLALTAEGPQRFGDAYLIQLDDWVRRTAAGEPPAVTGADGRAALEIAVAATRSAQEGGVVRLRR